jgi:plastocyanin
MTLTVSVGTTVTWKFDDSTQHTVTANDNSFTSSPMASGQTYTHTFNTAAPGSALGVPPGARRATCGGRR